MFGRRRYVPEIHSRTPALQAQAERIAFNFPIQGTEADILNQAMISLHQLMIKQYPDARLVLTVHDELVAEVPEGYVDEFTQVMKKIMENAIALDVPLVVDVGVADNWKDAG